MDFSSQFQLIENSVVNVIVFQNETTIISTGTGVIIGDGRKVLTCSHCVNQNLYNTVRFSGSNVNENYLGKVIYNDPIKDIAVIEFNFVLGNAVKLRDSSSVKIGQEAFVVGFPSNISEITALSANIAGFAPINNHYSLIRVDSPVNHGNSGGPLFNKNGELIGIINLKHGGLSKFLEEVESSNTSSVEIRMSGIDPIRTMKTLISEMKRNLNLGIGYAIPINTIGDDIPFVKTSIQQ